MWLNLKKKVKSWQKSFKKSALTADSGIVFFKDLFLLVGDVGDLVCNESKLVLEKTATKANQKQSAVNTK